MGNRLALETSPYLLQHKENPVDWYPWGEEALSRARVENKPILLSIGYSSCHWCHVMEDESFEDSGIAQLMNEHFISIKVDREERPDLDQIYQNVAQALTQSGGWPLNVFLTPDLKPFFGGTYFPPEDQYGKPGFGRVLSALAKAYEQDQKSVVRNSLKLTEIISSLETISSDQRKKPEWKDFAPIAENFLERIDWAHGGITGAPKFPHTMGFTFLWRYGNAIGTTSENKPIQAVLKLLVQMASGGIFDQLGGGFHRYSVDAFWRVPHFEKMLCDNALLLKLYSEVLLSRSPAIGTLEQALFFRVIHETVDFIFREMTSPDGTFYSAQDADTEGEEGKFFVWSLDDLAKDLSESEATVFSLSYGLTDEGNFDEGTSVLFLDKNPSEVSKLTGFDEEQVKRMLVSSKEKLFQARSKRTLPHADKKVLTSWNALMISGLAWAAQACRAYGQNDLADRYYDAAVKAFQFLKKNVSAPNDRLLCTYQQGQAKGNAFLDDYSFLAMAALDLSRFAQNKSEISGYQKDAQKWINIILKHFKDPVGVGYFFTSDDHEKLIQRPKTIFDQSIPSGTAVALNCMAVLAEIQGSDTLTESREFQKKVTQELDEQMAALFPFAEQNALGLGEFLCFSLLHVPVQDFSE